MRSPRRRALLVATLTAIAAIVAACGPGGGSGPASVAPTDASATSAPPTSAPSAASSGSTGPSPSTALALPHDDPDLEAELPSEFNGADLFKLSVGPISSAGNPGAEPIRELADDLGDGSGNFSLAFANDPASPTFSIYALRIPGAESIELLEGYTGLLVSDRRGAETDRLALGGQDIIQVTDPSSTIGDDFFYAVGDTLYGVQAGSEADAAELIELLP